MKAHFLLLALTATAVHGKGNNVIEPEEITVCPPGTIEGENDCFSITARAYQNQAIQLCGADETLVTGAEELTEVLQAQTAEMEFWTDAAKCIAPDLQNYYCMDGGAGDVVTGPDGPLVWRAGKCVGFKWHQPRNSKFGSYRYVVRRCNRACPAVCTSQMIKIIEYCIPGPNRKVPSWNNIKYGFWMYKTENNDQNGNKDNSQTFRGGDGFCQGRAKGSLPHLYNSEFVEAAELEMMTKLNIDFLTSADTFWSALSWNLPGQQSRSLDLRNNGNGKNKQDPASCQNEGCNNMPGLLWERHQTRGDTVDFVFVPNTFTQLDMIDETAGLYRPSDSLNFTGSIEPREITIANDKGYIVCMLEC